eukprot:1768149-Prymnesium_polylepis.1
MGRRDRCACSQGKRSEHLGKTKAPGFESGRFEPDSPCSIGVENRRSALIARRSLTMPNSCAASGMLTASRRA